ncbi:MAG: DNA-binding protein YbaB [Phycisphaerales bacterium]|jgi:DNA-binding protein YbaB
MLSKLKAAQAVASLMKNKDKLADAASRVKFALERMKVERDAGGGACRVTVTGTMRVLKVELSDPLVAGMNTDAKARELAGDLIAQATNNAIHAAQQEAKELITKELEGLGIEGLDDLVGSDLTSLMG